MTAGNRQSLRGCLFQFIARVQVTHRGWMSLCSIRFLRSRCPFPFRAAECSRPGETCAGWPRHAGACAVTHFGSETPTASCPVRSRFSALPLTLYSSRSARVTSSCATISRSAVILAHTGVVSLVYPTTASLHG